MVTPSAEPEEALSEASAIEPVLLAASVPPFSTSAMLPLLLNAPVQLEVPFSVIVPLAPPKSSAPVTLAVSARVRVAPVPA